MHQPARKEIDLLINLLNEMRKIDAEFPLQYALCLAEIARDDGMSLSALSARTGLALSTVSRIIGALSKYRQSGAAYGLVKVKISATERRRKELTLTARGKAVMAGFIDVLHKN